MLGTSELPLRQGFACGKTLVRRKRAAPPCGAPVLSGIYTLRTRQKETPADRLVFLFGFRRPKAASTLSRFKCSAELNSACAEVLACGQNARRLQKRRPTVWGPVTSSASQQDANMAAPSGAAL